MERIDDLQYQELRIIQDDELPCFTEDAVLLANFLRAGPQDVVVDLGAGSGVISILGQRKTGARFVGVEQQPQLAALARRSAAMNGQAIPFYEMNVRDAPRALGHGAFTVAVSNPPYFSAERTPTAAESRSFSRHGDARSLDSFIAAAFLLLKNGGRFFACWPISGLTDMLCVLRGHRLEPKRVQIVCQRGTPRLALIEAKKLAGHGMAVTLFNPST